MLENQGVAETKRGGGSAGGGDCRAACQTALAASRATLHYYLEGLHCSATPSFDVCNKNMNEMFELFCNIMEGVKMDRQ